MSQSLDSTLSIPRPQNATGQLKQLYLSGRLRVDCLIVQCVNFNHTLYNRLLQLHESAYAGDTCLKRKQENVSASQENQEKPRKKRKD